MRYYNQHPEEWGKDFKSEEDFDEKVQTCLEKREKIQEKQIQMANEVYNLKCRLLLLNVKILSYSINYTYQ